ncbi:MAG: hypothetical protein JW936_00990 [Sedimentisphaerales bacterium]|nr:hypothetical protein [Sedimentisphaerales bacterium]
MSKAEKTTSWNESRQRRLPPDVDDPQNTATGDNQFCSYEKPTSFFHEGRGFFMPGPSVVY